MKLNRKYLPPLALAGALALVPVTASTFAAADTTNYQELEKLMSVYERVKANYVDKVDDKTLIKGAIDGMLSALDPHSSYVEANDFDQLRTTTDGNYGGLGLTVSIEDGAVKVIAPTEDTPAWRAGRQGGRLHHPHRQRAGLRPVARRSGREDARRSRHRRSS